MTVIETAAVILAENENPLLPNVDEIVIGFIAFAVVFGFLAAKLLPSIRKALEERTDAIEGGIQRAKDAQAEAQATLEDYRRQLAEARHEAGRLREEAREQGVEIIADLRTQAQGEAARIVAAARAQTQVDRQQAFNELRSQVGRIAVDLAGRVVGESLQDEARQSRVVERFLAELESAQPLDALGAAGDGEGSAPPRTTGPTAVSTAGPPARPQDG